MRQVTRLQDDHQTPILTSRTDLGAAQVAHRMFSRWRQENYFRYARQHFALDALDWKPSAASSWRAYYAGAIDVAMLREEQDRIGRETRQAEELLKVADAGLAEWQSVLDLAMRLATDCATAYRLADPRIKRQFNEAVFEEIMVRDGHVAEARYRSPFGPFFAPEFEHSGLERETGVSRASGTYSAVEVRYRLVPH